MTNILLQIVWVAAHHGLRRRSALCRSRGVRPESDLDWFRVQTLTHALGNPPAPGGGL